MDTMVIKPDIGTIGSVGRSCVMLENETDFLAAKGSIKCFKVSCYTAAQTFAMRKTVDQHLQMTWLPKSSLTVKTSGRTSINF